jgi:hypothetical protein
MTFLTAPLNAISLLPPYILLVITPIVLAAVVFASTYLTTTIRYRLSLAQDTSNPTKPTPPPQIPYTLPFLGSALSFLAPHPGEFWKSLFQRHPRSTGACTLLLGGRRSHVLFSPSAVQALFKARGLSRQTFNEDLLIKGLGVSAEETAKFYGTRETPDEKGQTSAWVRENLNHEYMLKTDAVNELTSEFNRVLSDQVADELRVGDEIREIGIYEWLRPIMFKASTTALMGQRILEVYPGLCDDFFAFDSVMLTMFFGIPKWIVPKAYAIRARTLDGLEKWHVQMREDGKGKPVDPEGGVKWEPVYGSRLIRARQLFYETRGISTRSRASIDLGFMFGLSSNAIPATGWMLLHILNPGADKTLLPRVMMELESARREDGTLDLTVLLGLPLLQAVFHEVLRLYVDVLVSRTLHDDLALPLDDGKRQLLLKKNDIVMAPSWLGQRDEARWTDPPSDVFCAERFLKTDAETGREVFSLTGMAGKFFPFGKTNNSASRKESANMIIGGGKNMCPGRVFAKQEVLASVAMVLLAFEFEVIEFVDEHGKSKARFPGLKQAYSGTGVVAMDGDAKVRMRRRQRS